jgi:hypothetical protein
MEKIWAMHLKLQGRLQENQLMHFDNIEQKTTSYMIAINAGHRWQKFTYKKKSPRHWQSRTHWQIIGVETGHWLKKIKLSLLALQNQVLWLTFCGIGFDII